MGYIIFNGKDSREFGVMESIPYIPTAEQKVYTAEILNGAPIIYQSETLEPIRTPTFTLNVRDTSIENVYAIKAWLRGNGKLITSRDPSTYYNAYCSAGVSPESISRRLGKIPFSFILEPHRYAVDNTERDVDMYVGDTNKFATIENHGTASSEPEYTVETNAEDAIIWGHGGYYVIKNPGTHIINTARMSDQEGSEITFSPDIRYLRLPPGRTTLTTTLSVVSLKVKLNERYY